MKQLNYFLALLVSAVVLLLLSIIVSMPFEHVSPAGAFVGLIIGLALIDAIIGHFRPRPVSKDLLVRRVSSEEVEEFYARTTADHYRQEIEKFRALLLRGDEIWLWSTPDWTWEAMTGRQGMSLSEMAKPPIMFCSRA